MLNGYKTYLLAAATFIYAGLGVLLGHLDGNTALQLIVTALGLAFVRHGVANSAQ